MYNYCLIKDLRFLPANGSVKRQILPKEKVIGQTSSVQTRTVRNGSHATNTADWRKFWRWRLARSLSIFKCNAGSLCWVGTFVLHLKAFWRRVNFTRSNLAHIQTPDPDTAKPTRMMFHFWGRRLQLECSLANNYVQPFTSTEKVGKWGQKPFTLLASAHEEAWGIRKVMILWGNIVLSEWLLKLKGQSINGWLRQLGNG